TLRLAPSIAALSCELYLWPGCKSYTGEPVAEFHTLGSPPLLDLLIGRLCDAGARLAQPGEFTLRAFLSRRIDLTQVEAVLGVIDAHDQEELDVALAQLAGGLAQPLHALRDTLLDLLGHLEAGFDFADEDLPFIESEELVRQLDSAAEITDKLVRQISTRSTSDDVPRVALIGRPNTGKSSLFNTLSKKSKAIVSHYAGTTRDYLTAELDLDGVPCRLIDTAGVDTDTKTGFVSTEPASVEQESQEIARQQAQKAQVRIVCIDSTRPPNLWEESQISDRQHLIAWTKCDAAESSDKTAPSGSIATSSITGRGIDELRRRLREAVLVSIASTSAVVAPTAVRCRESIRLAAESLARARNIVVDSGSSSQAINGEELIAAELRVALDELGKVVGTIYTDDVLDRIFSRFCVGK
ncbi:MAG: tRNA modification GTPase, partial [Pirellulales bacterium]|nr:tRNA modification GTPase [Pirellulales bacterium]